MNTEIVELELNGDDILIICAGLQNLLSDLVNSRDPAPLREKLEFIAETSALLAKIFASLPEDHRDTIKNLTTAIENARNPSYYPSAANA